MVRIAEKFRSADRVERVSGISKPMQYLKDDHQGFHFMDNETFEQVTLETEFVGDKSGI